MWTMNHLLPNDTLESEEVKAEIKNSVLNRKAKGQHESLQPQQHHRAELIQQQMCTSEGSMQTQAGRSESAAQPEHWARKRERNQDKIQKCLLGKTQNCQTFN